MNLFFSAYRFGRPIGEVFRAVLPLAGVLALALLALTLWPALSTGLVAALK
jgi:TRAP-type C4-dicarboxylate transport system permease large subunit